MIKIKINKNLIIEAYILDDKSIVYKIIINNRNPNIPNNTTILNDKEINRIALLPIKFDFPSFSFL